MKRIDIQRLCDILFASSAIVVLLPVLCLIILILRLTGEGEIFYCQERVGKNRKPIYVLKFATMLKDSPNIGSGTITLMDDPRVLPFGVFLRKTKINELPQLFNILKGDMSIIGPRPQTNRCFDAFLEESREKISSVRPGLSGVGSIFFRNEELIMCDANHANKVYDEIIMPFKGKLEEWYVDNTSFKLYIYLIFATLIVVSTGKIPFSKSVFSSIPKIPEELESYI